MKLEIESVKIKNFLSFGNVENHIPFQNGVNVVLGRDVATGRSNGAGKSSFLESIPYALFGQTHKGIKKEQLVNWKNGRDCRVELNFKIGEVPFKIVRGIKPDIFDIYQEGGLIEKTAHIRDYQKILEDIIGLNFNTFVSLIHTNINSSNRILSMKAGEKRKFMEDVFGLWLYSKLTDKSNEKMRGATENLYEVTLIIASNNTTILNTKSQIDDINEKIKRLGSSVIELRDAEADFEKLIDKNPDIEMQINKLDEEIKTIDNRSRECERSKWKSDSEQERYKEKIRDIENNLDQLKKSKKTETEYFKFIKEEGDIHSIVEKIDLVKVEIAKLESDLEVNLTKSREIDLELVRVKTIGNFECPQCGYSAKDTSADLTILNKKLLKSTKEWKKLKDKLEDYKGRKGELEQKRDWLLKMQENIRTDVDPIKMEKKLAEAKHNLKAIQAEYEHQVKDIDKLQNLISFRTKEKEELRLKKIRLDNQKGKIEALKMKIGLEEQARKEFQAIIKTNIEKIKNTEKENSKLGNKEKNIKLLLDYFNVIKELCKDENIKQYAISSIMPYLNQQTNLYLSEVGYGFYAVIDKWLKAQIKGPGVSKASYGSLSGGEGRGIDLAIQFALLDIARIQAGIWPDILIMDEILDSSVDSKGIAKLVEIIRAKQVQENNKIFVISHREEIGDEFEADFQYFITKDRYSKVEVR